MTGLVDLYVVNWAAMQAVSAIEARAHYGGRAVLIAEPRAKDFDVLDRVRWDHQLWLDIRTRGAPLERAVHWLRFKSAVAELLDEIGPVGRLFVGHLGTPMCHIANASHAREVIVLDAGLVTAQVAKERIAPRQPVRRWAASIAQRVLGLEPGLPGAVTFFTAYDLDVGVPDRIQRHAFEHLRAGRNAQPRNDECWFIGQNFVEGGMMTPQRYESILGSAVASAGQRIRYIAHPREDVSRLAVLAAAFNVEVVRNRRPFEVELLDLPWPQRIFGVSSSALHSAATLCGTSVDICAFRIRALDVLRFEAGLDGAYEMLARVGVRLVEVPT